MTDKEGFSRCSYEKKIGETIFISRFSWAISSAE